MRDLLIVIIILLIIYLVIYEFVKRKYSIEDRFFYQPVNKVQRWIEVLFLTIYLIVRLTIANKTESYSISVFPAFALLYGFRTFMEWKYRKDSKKYLLFLTTCIFSVVISIGFLLFSGKI